MAEAVLRWYACNSLQCLRGIRLSLPMYKWLLLLYLLWVFISMSYYMYGQTKQEQRHHAGDEAKRDGRSTSSSSLD
jgi:hypothetical protein